eukprot:CAMPEP_0176110148 /NCGR_PEP_ID=MMETSP0120_2-20121206/55309_1 /TAXON_ID=160619 /ORGANISM="Kryptoperidinium foliaceum, Strain CCMP 1326" /LENGTH=52 /DNA_ID=CAMNT_0017444351 /DNA_START=15 /DNA_END=170 /DNA_ORIENTATION=+
MTATPRSPRCCPVSSRPATAAPVRHYLHARARRHCSRLMPATSAEPRCSRPA